MKACFIYNPRSGFNIRHPEVVERARSFIATQRWDARLQPTERARHATEIARDAVAAGCELVVAIGGDGTMNEIAQALVGRPVALGLVPTGSGNGLGRHLGISDTNALEVLARGRTRSIDSGSANGLPFFNAMGMGFDAEISHRFNRLASRGLPAYLRTCLQTFFQYQHEHYTICHGDGTIETRAFLLSVANSDQYGNNCYIAPGATVDDGQLDLTVVKPIGLFGAMAVASRLFRSTANAGSKFLRLRGAQFTIARRGPGFIHTDGEVHAAGREIAVAVHPRSLRVRVP